jgi:hypothetical protein
MWITSFVALIPGDLAGALTVEKLLWTVGLAPTELAIIEMLISVLVNACVWLVLVMLIRMIRSHVINV